MGEWGGYKKNKKLSICNLINFVWAPESRLNQFFGLNVIIYTRTNIKRDHGLKNKLISRINLIYQYVYARLGKFRSADP